MSMNSAKRNLALLLGVALLTPAGARAPAVNSGDIKYLLCPVCRETALTLANTVQDARASGISVNEEMFIDLVSSVCDPTTPGSWIRHADYALASDQKSLELALHQPIGRCNSECLTIAHACAKVVDGLELEIADALFSAGLGPEEFEQEMCRELSTVCAKRPALKAPEGRGAAPFEPLSDDEAQAEMEAAYAQRYGQEYPGGDGLDEDYGEEDEMSMPSMPIPPDSPLARLETALHGAYAATSERLGLPVVETPLDALDKLILGLPARALRWVGGVLASGRSASGGRSAKPKKAEL